MSDNILIPEPGQQYLDVHGARVTVTDTEENRVIFMREGYPHHCMRPLHFMSKFHLIQSVLRIIPGDVAQHNAFSIYSCI
ncbi:TPA: DUF4222 domain-containing protein [Escherichia coli]|nr:DUF4222 domain-containing protein [Escherichia marmotae]HAY0228441.1 DUF4222 domain-containing protein [Escherichia coli]HEL8020804.1 DUF4222 domain-containing protein [Escherichia coli]HEL8087173.1 DUF4222 domain-containing protein [Escherichia coli]HEL8092310.1 DUF4222 domain-containing protein [Escherichia coli]